MSWPVATPDGLRGGTELRAATAAWWLGACAVGPGSPIRSTAAPGILPSTGCRIGPLGRSGHGLEARVSRSRHGPAYGGCRRCPRATLTVVGADPSIDVPGVEVVGRVPQHQVSDYLGKAAVFCMPTRREAFGIVYLEAMRAGLPVVATDICAIPDFVLEGQTGYRVSVDDVDSLAARLEQLISDPQECRRMGERGRALVESKYTWARTQQMMWAAIRSALESESA